MFLFTSVQQSSISCESNNALGKLSPKMKLVKSTNGQITSVNNRKNPYGEKAQNVYTELVPSLVSQ